MMSKNMLLIILVTILALAGGIYTQSVTHSEQQSRQQTALNFTLPDLTGKIRQPSDWSGKIRIINFWATWCPPCIKEIPEFIKLQAELKDQNLQFIGIAIQDKQEVLDYIRTIKINYPILIGGDDAIFLSQKLGNLVNAVPFTIIVNQQGQIVHRQPGELSKTKILKIITPLL